jgi:hypothetical protein
LILEKELNDLPNVKEVSIYEDSLEQLKKYQDFFYGYSMRKIKAIDERQVSLDDFMMLNMQFVDKSKVISLYEFSTGETRRIELQ